LRICKRTFTRSFRVSPLKFSRNAKMTGLFVIGALGFLFGGRQLILMLLALELMVFVAAFRFVYFGFGYDNRTSSQFALYLLVLADVRSFTSLHC